MLSTQHELMKELPAAEETATLSRRRRRSSVEHSDCLKVAKTSTITSASATQDSPANLAEDTMLLSETGPVESIDTSMLAVRFYLFFCINFLQILIYRAINKAHNIDWDNVPMHVVIKMNEDIEAWVRSKFLLCY